MGAAEWARAAGRVRDEDQDGAGVIFVPCGILLDNISFTVVLFQYQNTLLVQSSFAEFQFCQTPGKAELGAINARRETT